MCREKEEDEEDKGGEESDAEDKGEEEEGGRRWFSPWSGTGDEREEIMDSRVGIEPDTDSSKDVSVNISESEELKLISLKYWSKVSPASRVSSNLLPAELSILSPSRIGLHLRGVGNLK